MPRPSSFRLPVRRRYFSLLNYSIFCDSSYLKKCSLFRKNFFLVCDKFSPCSQFISSLFPVNFLQGRIFCGTRKKFRNIKSIHLEDYFPLNTLLFQRLREAFNTILYMVLSWQFQSSTLVLNDTCPQR